MDKSIELHIGGVKLNTFIFDKKFAAMLSIVIIYCESLYLVNFGPKWLKTEPAPQLSNYESLAVL